MQSWAEGLICQLYSLCESKQLPTIFCDVSLYYSFNFFFATLTAVSCHRISKSQELERAVAEVGNWESLCDQLEVPKEVLSDLRFANMENIVKKNRCLEAYFNTGNACWETVVRVVASHPIHNPRVAMEIAAAHGLDYRSIVGWTVVYPPLAVLLLCYCPSFWFTISK